MVDIRSLTGRTGARREDSALVRASHISWKPEEAASGAGQHSCDAAWTKLVVGSLWGSEALTVVGRRSLGQAQGRDLTIIRIPNRLAEISVCEIVGGASSIDLRVEEISSQPQLNVE